jgi:hypothetical protein
MLQLKKNDTACPMTQRASSPERARVENLPILKRYFEYTLKNSSFWLFQA